MEKYRVRFVSSLATEANEEWVTTPELTKGELSKWITKQCKELGKTALETQPA